MRRIRKTTTTYLPYPERRWKLTHPPLCVTLPKGVHARLEKLVAAYKHEKKSQVVARAIMALAGPAGEDMQDVAPE